MRFKEIPGNNSVKEALRQLVDSGKIPHAIMLTGSSGIGKMMTARAFAAYTHCTNKSGGEPCGVCNSCRQHVSLNHPDVHYIYPIVKNKTKNILLSTDLIDKWKDMLAKYPTMPPEKWLDIIDAGNSQPSIYVEEAQRIVETEPYSPFAAEYKFYIIWLPERMRPETANKLLKVIEEPTPGSIFLLVSNEEDKLLPTIVSRTQRFNMSPLSREEISGYLMSKYHLPEYKAYELSRLAEGKISKADEIGSNSGENSEFDSFFRDIMRAAYAKKISLLKILSEKTASFGREKLIRFLDYMARLVRENFIYNFSLRALNNMTKSEEDFSKNFSPFINIANVEDISSEISRTRNDVGRNANAKIVMFDFFMILIGLLHRKVPQT